MKKLAILLFIIIGFSSAQAAEDDLGTLKNFSTALQMKNYETAKQYISAASHDLFDRYTKYDLGDMTPGYSKTVSQSKSGNFRYLKVQTTATPPKVTNVAFVNESGESKIDLPETARLGLGQNWQQKIDLIEQSYVSSRQYFGEAQSRQLLRTMVSKR